MKPPLSAPADPRDRVRHIQHIAFLWANQPIDWQVLSVGMRGKDLARMIVIDGYANRVRVRAL